MKGCPALKKRKWKSRIMKITAVLRLRIDLRFRSDPKRSSVKTRPIETRLRLSSFIGVCILWRALAIINRRYPGLCDAKQE